VLQTRARSRWKTVGPTKFPPPMIQEIEGDCKMNQRENNFYQQLICCMRERNTRGGWHWPEKPSAAATRYPNVAAEIDASGQWLWCPADHAGACKDILAAVLEDNEELSAAEMLGLARLYRAGFEYLASPKLQLIDPATRNGKIRRWQLQERFAHAEGLDKYEISDVQYVLTMMELGAPITYAAWRQACQTIEDARMSKPTRRIERRTCNG